MKARSLRRGYQIPADLQLRVIFIIVLQLVERGNSLHVRGSFVLHLLLVITVSINQDTNASKNTNNDARNLSAG